MAYTMRAGPISKFIFAIIFIIAGYLITFNLGLPQLKEANTSTQWPTVTGKVIYSKLVKSRNGGKTMYSADIEY